MKLTIPRLEFIGPVIAVRLTKTLVMELHSPIHHIVIWSDSASLLHWIGKWSSGYRALFGNHISETDHALTGLREKLYTKEVYFRHITSDLNPADDATRSLKLAHFVDDNRWRNGPKFLCRLEDSRPEQRFVVVKDLP